MKSWDCGNVSRLTFCDFQDNYGLAGFKKATSLKYKHPHLKVHNQTNILVSFFKSEGAQTNILFLFEILLLSSTPTMGRHQHTNLYTAQTNSPFQVSLAIGGWNEGSAKYSAMAKDPKVSLLTFS